MFKDNNLDRITEETKHYAQQAMETKPDPTGCETNAEVNVLELNVPLG